MALETQEILLTGLNGVVSASSQAFSKKARRIPDRYLRCSCLVFYGLNYSQIFFQSYRSSRDAIEACAVSIMTFAPGKKETSPVPMPPHKTASATTPITTGVKLKARVRFFS